MARKHKPEEIIGTLCEAEIVVAQGRNGGRCLPSDRCHRIELLPLAQGVWQPEDGSGAVYEGPGARECPAAAGGSDLTLDKLILQEAARGNY